MKISLNTILLLLVVICLALSDALTVSVPRQEVVETRDKIKRKMASAYRIKAAQATAATSALEKDALIKLYQSTIGEEWHRSDNWLQGDPCLDAWFGVDCSTTGSIIQLNLPSNNLVGTIPSQLSQLVHLESIILDYNVLSDSIPSQLFINMDNLTSIQLQNNLLGGDISWTESLPLGIAFLWVAGNEFTGSIPKTWSKYPKLDFIFVELNRLTGQIPNEIGDLKMIRLLDIGFNDITGPIPETIKNLEHLTHFWCYDNRLSGNLPLALGNMTSIEMVEFTRNKLSGEIPIDLFSDRIPIQSIRLSGNKFRGTIDWICTLPKIVEILLDDNEFTDLPRCITMAPTQLVDFVVSGNGISGTIPEEFGNFTALRFINLRQNKLYGALPTSFNRCVNLSRLDISENRFNCSLPGIIDPIRKLSWISIIKANDNEITGEFNEDMFWDSDTETELLKSLFILDLSKNQLTGQISDYLSWMLSLSQLDLSHNRFVGSIPDVLNFLSELYLENNTMASPTGDLPSFMVPSHNLIQLEGETFSCPTILGKFSEIRISMDASYYNYSFCQCEIGTRGFNGTCEVCPENAVCPGGGNTIIVPSGYFPIPAVDDPLMLLRCPVSNFGTTSCNPDSSSNYTCKVGYVDQSVIVFIIVLIVFALLFVFFVLTDPKRSLPSSTRKTIVFYYQGFNLLLTKLSPWPSFFSFYYSSSSFINFSFGFLCIGEMSKWPNLFIIIILLPPVVLAISAIFLGVVAFVYLVRRKHFDWRWFRSSIRVNLVVLNFLYLPLCIYILQNYSCTHDGLESDDSYMSFFPWISCSDPNGPYPSIYKATIATTILYIIGIPALFAFLLWRYRGRLEDPYVLSFVGSIYIDYRKTVYWYELVGLGRRLLMAVSLALIDPKSSFSVFVVLLVIGCSIIGQISFRPFIYKISNFSELVGIGVLLFSYVCIMILASLKATNQYDSSGIQIILAVVVVLYTVYLGLLFLFSLKYFLPKKMQMRLDDRLGYIFDKIREWKMAHDERRQREEEDPGFEQTIDPLFKRSASSINSISAQTGIELKRRTINALSQSHQPPPGIGPATIGRLQAERQKPYNSSPNLGDQLPPSNNMEYFIDSNTSINDSTAEIIRTNYNNNNSLDQSDDHNYNHDQ
eukprot:gene3788-4368_t